MTSWNALMLLIVKCRTCAGPVLLSGNVTTAIFVALNSGTILAHDVMTGKDTHIKHVMYASAASRGFFQMFCLYPLPFQFGSQGHHQLSKCFFS